MAAIGRYCLRMSRITGLLKDVMWGETLRVHVVGLCLKGFEKDYFEPDNVSTVSRLSKCELMRAIVRFLRSSAFAASVSLFQGNHFLIWSSFASTHVSIDFAKSCSTASL